MTKDEVIAWFQHTDNLAPVIRTMRAAPAAGAAPDTPMMLVSIRLPVALVEHLDLLAEQSATRRSEVIRDALTGYVTARTAPVSHDEAEHALDVLCASSQARRDWKNDPTLRDRYRRHRPNIERVISQIASRGGRRLKLRYRGMEPNNAWLKRRTAGLNLRNLINQGLHWASGWALTAN